MYQYGNISVEDFPPTLHHHPTRDRSADGTGGRGEHGRGVSASGGEGLVPARLGRGAEVLQNPFSRDPGPDRQQEDEV